MPLLTQPRYIVELGTFVFDHLLSPYGRWEMAATVQINSLESGVTFAPSTADVIATHIRITDRWTAIIKIISIGSTA